MAHNPLPSSPIIIMGSTTSKGSGTRCSKQKNALAVFTGRCDVVSDWAGCSVITTAPPLKSSGSQAGRNGCSGGELILGSPIAEPVPRPRVSANFENAARIRVFGSFHLFGHDAIATPSAELEYVSDRDGGFKQPLERCKLLTRWAFEYFDQTAAKRSANGFCARCFDELDDRSVKDEVVLALFTVGDVYASLCKKGAYAPFSAQRRSRTLIWL